MPSIVTADIRPQVRTALARYIMDNYCLQFGHCSRSHMCIYGIEASNRWCLICKSYTVLSRTNFKAERR